MSQAGAPASARPLCQARPAHRILVVEDDGDIRRINTEVLTQSGYQVDAAEDGAAAWDTLQRQRYDLMVTDNDMPKVSGVELLHKLHAARMVMPVIMATGQRPREFTLYPWLQPAALLLKPYTFAVLLGTVRNVLGLPVLVAMLLLGLPAAIHAQKPLQPPSGLRSLASGSTAQASAPVFSAAANGAVNARVETPAPPLLLQSPDSPAQPNAVTVSVRGKCDYSEDGVTFASLANGHVFEQGAIVRTGEDGRADLFPAYWNHRPAPGRHRTKTRKNDDHHERWTSARAYLVGPSHGKDFHRRPVGGRRQHVGNQECRRTRCGGRQRHRPLHHHRRWNPRCGQQAPSCP